MADGVETAGAGVETAGAGVETAGAGVETAGAGVETAGAGVETAVPDLEATVPGRSRAGGLEPPVPVPMATFRIMTVTSVQVDLPDQYPVLVLEEAEGERRSLAFRIGMAEGVALAHAVHGTSAPRPLTHDVFAEVLERLRVDVVAVRLVGRSGATYLAELELMGPRGREVVGCRPTDGIALALRQKVPAPVLADDRLLAGSGDVPAPAA